MHLWTEIRRLVLTKQKSKRAICQEYQLHWKTLAKILKHAEPPGYPSAQRCFNSEDVVRKISPLASGEAKS